MVTLVPFNASWLDNGSLDVMAVYRRPRTHHITREPLLEDGRPLWDYVNLPIKRHNDWLKKGHQYVTLARVSDLQSVRAVTPERLASYKPNGDADERTFLIGQYLKTASVVEDQQTDALRALVEQLGSEAVEQVKRLEDPGFRLPAALQNITPASGREPVEAASKKPTVEGKKAKRGQTSAEVPA